MPAGAFGDEGAEANDGGLGGRDGGEQEAEQSGADHQMNGNAGRSQEATRCAGGAMSLSFVAPGNVWNPLWRTHE